MGRYDSVTKNDVMAVEPAPMKHGLRNFPLPFSTLYLTLEHKSHPFTSERWGESIQTSDQFARATGRFVFSPRSHRFERVSYFGEDEQQSLVKTGLYRVERVRAEVPGTAKNQARGRHLGLFFAAGYEPESLHVTWQPRPRSSSGVALRWNGHLTLDFYNIPVQIAKRVDAWFAVLRSGRLDGVWQGEWPLRAEHRDLARLVRKMNEERFPHLRG